MNTPALVSRLDHKALPQWNSGAPGYISMNAPAQDDGSRQASRFGTALRRYWWVALLIWALIGIPATVAIYKTMKPQYVATGIIVVQPFNPNPLTGRDTATPFFSEYLRSQIDLIRSYDVLNRAKNDPAVTQFQWFRELPDQVMYLQRNVTAEIVPGTLNIRIAMTHDDPMVAKSAVQAVRDAYVAQNHQDQQDVNNVALGQLRELEKSTLKELSDKQGLLNQRMSEADMAGPEKWLPDVLASGHSRLAELRRNRFAIEAELKAVTEKELPKQEVFMNSLNTDSDSQIMMWEKARVEATQQDSVLETKFKAQPQHPDRRALRAQVTKLNSQIAARRTELRENAWKKYEAESVLEQELKKTNLAWNLKAVDTQIERQEKNLTEQEERARVAGNRALPIATLREEITELKEEAKVLSARVLEVEKQNSPLGRLDPKLVGLPATPTVDKRPKLALAANGLGFMLGLGVLVILMKLRDKIDYAEDLPTTFQPLIVGTVSHAGAAARGIEGRMSKKILGEEMRLLHANLLPPGPMQRRIMMITSPTPSNGKTSIASQLALSLAKSGLEVLLIDADLRKRDLSTMFDVGFRPGLADLLQGRTPELIRPVELLPNLRLMGAGTKLDRNPVELFQRKHFHENLNMLQEKFDVIVVDTPPTLVVADARLIARSADEVLCVVRAQVSSPKDVNQTLDALQRITGKTPKIILNGVAHKQSYYKYKFAYTSGQNEAATSADTLD